MQEQQPRSSGYGLVPPTEASLLAAIGRVLTPRRAHDVWERACTSVGIERQGPSLELGMLHQIAKHLAAQPDLVGVMGVSLSVRIETYAILGGISITFPPQEQVDASRR